MYDFDKFPPPPIYDIIPIDVIMKNAQESQRVEAVSDSIQVVREAKKHFNKKDDEKKLLCGFHT